MLHCQHDLDRMEVVQRKFTIIVIGTEGLEYRERLKVLNMFFDKRRLLRGDMIEIYKLFSGMVDLYVGKFFTIETE